MTVQPLATRMVAPAATTSSRADEGPHQATQPVRIENRVGVDGADQLAARDVEPDIEGVGLTPVLLRDDDQIGELARR